MWKQSIEKPQEGKKKRSRKGKGLDVREKSQYGMGGDTESREKENHQHGGQENMHHSCKETCTFPPCDGIKTWDLGKCHDRALT